MNVTNDTLQICKAYNIEPNQVIFAFAVAAGAPLADAYMITHRMKATTTTEEAETLANALLTARPGLKIIINRIKNKQNPATFKRQQADELEKAEKEQQIKEEEKDELKTRDGLIRKIIDNVLLSSGKDAISGLQTLAKLQGLDRPDDEPEEERRKYVLRWLSACRSCKLMQLFMEVQERNSTKNDGFT